MESDYYKFSKKCHKCHIYADKIHVPPTLLNVISSLFPFSMWGIDTAHQAVEDYQSMKFECLDEDIITVDNCEGIRPYDGPEQGSRWTLFFDEASNALGNGIGVVLISPEGCHTPFTARLCFNCTNNMAEYEACIFGLKATIDLGIKSLDVFGDSALVIS